MSDDKRLVRSTVAALLLDKNKNLLLTKRAVEPFKGEWTTPGGHVDFGETVEDAVRREVREETGLVMTDPKYLGYMDEVLPAVGWHGIVHIFTGPWKGTPKPNAEVSDIQWFTKDEFPDLTLAFLDADLLKTYYPKAKR